MWRRPAITWGLFAHPEASLAALGDVAGREVLELGCGTAYLSGWLARAGARVVALDLSPAQLATARRCQRTIGPAFGLVEADGAVLPVRDAAVDIVVSEYGVAPWCDPDRWLAEAARVLRPDGRLVFLTSSVLAAMCVPAEGGVAGDRLLRGPADLRPVAWPGGGVEHHPSHGEWIALLHANGFTVEALHELTPPAGEDDHAYYEIVSAAWAARWPAEDLWVARRQAK
ncbi:MAG: methyltransferase domain-containing protein [Acidimicrobiales bacterium]|nr:methyltransferase domain-containing protein [Acidimicrobiales bacterium]